MVLKWVERKVGDVDGTIEMLNLSLQWLVGKRFAVKVDKYRVHRILRVC